VCSVVPFRSTSWRSSASVGFRCGKRFLGTVLLGGCFFLTRAARADENGPAQAAYEQGVDAFRAGDFLNACRLLAESYRLEPLPGVLFTWATCELRAERLASAATHYADFLNAVARLPPAERAAQEERRRSAQRERARILPQVPFLTVVVSASVQHASSVLRDGTPLPPNAQGLEAAVDPGEHVIVFVGPDGARTEQRVVLAKGEHKTIVLGFANAREAAQAARPSSPPPLSPAAGDRPATSPWVYITGAAGVAGILTGSIAGLLAIHDKNVVDGACVGLACSARGKHAASAAKTEATVSTIGFGVGLAGLVSSVIIYLVDTPRTDARALPPKRWSVVAISPTAAGVAGVF